MNSLLYRKSLGRTAQLGQLYFAPSDSVLGFSIYPSSQIPPTFPDENQPKYSLDFIFEDISPLDLLLDNGSEEMKISVVANPSSANLQTLNNFIRNRTLGSKPNVLNGFLVSKNISIIKKLNFSNTLLTDRNCFTKESTHFIDQITYGSEVIIYFERVISPIEDRIDIQNSFIRIMNSHLQGVLSSTEMSFLQQFDYESYKTSNQVYTVKATILSEIKTPGTVTYPIEFRLSSISVLYNEMNAEGLVSPTVIPGFISSENLSFRPDVNKRILDLLHQRDNILIDTNDFFNSIDDQDIVHLDSLHIKDLTIEFGQLKSDDDQLRNQLFTELINSRKSSSYQGLINYNIDNTILQQFLSDQSEIHKNVHLIKYLKSNKIEIPNYGESKDAFMLRIASGLTCFLVNYNSFNSHFSNVSPFKILVLMGSIVGTNIVCGAFNGPQENSSGIQVYKATTSVVTLLNEPTSLLNSSNSNLVFRAGVNTTLTRNTYLPIYALSIKCPCSTCPNTKLKWSCVICGSNFHYQRKYLYCKCTGGALITSCQFLCNRLYNLHTLTTMDLVYHYIPETVDLSILFVSDSIDPGTATDPTIFTALKSLFLVSKSKDFSESLLTFNGFDDFIFQKFPNYTVYSNMRLQIVTTNFNFSTSIPSLLFFKQFDAIMMCNPSDANIQNSVTYLINKNYSNNVVFFYTSETTYNSVISNLPSKITYPVGFKNVDNYFLINNLPSQVIINRNESTLAQDSSNSTYITAYAKNVSESLEIFKRIRGFAITPIIPN